MNKSYKQDMTLAEKGKYGTLLNQSSNSSSFKALKDRRSKMISVSSEELSRTKTLSKKGNGPNEKAAPVQALTFAVDKK